MTKKFQDLLAVTVKDVNAALLRNDPEELQFVSLTLALSDFDFNYSQAVCVQLCSSTDARVRGNALLSLGHLARRYRRLDEPSVRPLVESGLRNADSYVRQSAKSAADEIHQFLHWSIEGHVFG